MKRVLFLAYLFPPIANSGTQRPLKFTKFLVEHGWEPIVLTAAHSDGHPTDPALLGEIPAGVRVIRVPMLNEWVRDAIASTLGRGSLATRVGDAVSWRLQTRRRVPDLYALWQPMVEREAARIFREVGFDAIYATGFPWSTLMAARAIARRTGRPLVADFRDLWSGESAFLDGRPTREQERAFEQQVVSAADAVVTTSETTTRWFTTAYPSESESKFVTIHNGFDSADLDVAPAPRNEQKFRIVYTGVWKEGYNPADLYNSVDWIRRTKPEVIENLEVVAAGFTPGEAQRRHLTKYITEVGRVPHHDAIALMRSADLLFLPHPDAMRQWAIPGKLYEYLASGKPVLALTDPEKETAKIIRTVGGGVAVSPDDPGNLYYSVMDACNGTLKMPARNGAALRSFERRELAGKLARVLNDVSDRLPVKAREKQWSHPAAAFPTLRPR